MINCWLFLTNVIFTQLFSYVLPMLKPFVVLPTFMAPTPIHLDYTYFKMYFLDSDFSFHFSVTLYYQL